MELRRNQPLGIEVIAKAIEPFDASQREEGRGAEPGGLKPWRQ